MARHFRWGLFLILVSVGASGFGGGRGEARDAEESAHGEKDSGVTEVEHKERPIADRQLAITDNDRDKLRRDLEDYFAKLGAVGLRTKREPGEYTPCGADDTGCQNEWYLERFTE